MLLTNTMTFKKRVKHGLIGSLVLVAGLFFSGLALADESACQVVIEGDDQMRFNVRQVEISKACEQFEMTLVHVGKLPKMTMGHNLVVTKQSDAQSASVRALAAGPAKDYIDPSDERVIAHTAMLGGGEQDSLVLNVSELDADETYTYFCSFPGHYAMMRGTIKLVD